MKRFYIKILILFLLLCIFSCSSNSSNLITSPDSVALTIEPKDSLNFSTTKQIPSIPTKSENIQPSAPPRKKSENIQPSPPPKQNCAIALNEYSGTMKDIKNAYSTHSEIVIVFDSEKCNLTNKLAGHIESKKSFYANTKTNSLSINSGKITGSTSNEYYSAGTMKDNEISLFLDNGTGVTHFKGKIYFGTNSYEFLSANGEWEFFTNSDGILSKGSWEVFSKKVVDDFTDDFAKKVEAGREARKLYEKRRSENNNQTKIPPTQNLQPNTTQPTSFDWVKTVIELGIFSADTPYEEAIVSRVIDGDTIQLFDGRIIRYLGIDTPETVHPNKPVECYGQEASFQNKILVLGKTIYLYKGNKDKDSYGRYLRYVVYPGSYALKRYDIFVNDWLVKSGSATVNSKYQNDNLPNIYNLLLNSQKEAQNSKKGLWGACR